MQQVTLFWKLETLSNSEVLGGLNELVGSSRRMLASVLAHLGEVEERRLHLSAGYGSMFAYCTSKLMLSEDEAYRRVEVARLARRYPALFPLIASGRISLSVAALLRQHLTAQNADELIQFVAGASVQRARELLAARFPRPDVPATIRKLPAPRRPRDEPSSLPGLLSPMLKLAEPPSGIVPPRETSPSIPPLAEAPPPPARAGVRRPSSARPIEPLSPGRYKIHLTADTELKNKLELARDLMRHALPSGDLSAIMARALDLLIEQLMKRRFGSNNKGSNSKGSSKRHTPAAPRSRSSASSPQSNVSRSTRRAVLERDGLRCSFRSEDGVQCNSRAWLEDDHIHPRARGGNGDVENVRMLCRAHNQWAAECTYGRAHVENAVRRKRAQRAQRTRAGSNALERGPVRTNPSNTSTRLGSRGEHPTYIDQQPKGSTSGRPSPPG